MGQAGHPAGHGVVDAVDDVPLVGALSQLADDLALGEDGAGRADGQILGGLGAQRPQLLHLHLQHPGHHVQEPAGAGGALVVHDKVLHAPLVVEADDLSVLPAHVHDGAGFRGEMTHPFGVTADLGDLLVRPLVGHPAIAGDHSVADLFRPHPCLGIGGLQGLMNALGPRAQVHHLSR